MKKKVVLALLATLLCLQTVGTAYAEVTETQTVDQQEVNDADGSTSASAKVEVLVPSNFTITVPKKITMDGEHGTADYTVKVKGDIPGTGVINVVPDSSFEMSAFRKDNITANVTQDKTAFAQAELTAAGDTGITEEGHIAAEGMSPGVWKGTLNFNISTENVGGYDVSKLHIDDYDYIVDEATKEVTLVKYKGSDTDVVVPAYFADEDGYRYKTLLYPMLFAKTNVTSVSFEKGVKTGINISSLFQEAGALQTADLSNLNLDKVENIGHLFDGCTALQSVNFGENTFPNLTSAKFTFNGCRSLASLDVSKWNMSNLQTDEGMFEYCNSLMELKLPETINRIDNFMFNHMESWNVEEFTMPKGIEYIGDTHIFYNCGKGDGESGFTKFVQQEDSDVYKVVDGALYSADMKRLISVPINKYENTWEWNMPEGVETFNGLSFSKNMRIKTLCIPNSFKIQMVKDQIGNEGSNLHVGLYVFASPWEFTVKDDNPNYSMYDYCIYSKDQTMLMAVPLKRFFFGDTTQTTLAIPEGTTALYEDAFYMDAILNNENGGIIATGKTLSLPASLQTIPDRQMEAINGLASKWGWTIQVADGNTHFEVVDNQLVAM